MYIDREVLNNQVLESTIPCWNICYVYYEEGDWEGVYVNGYLLCEGEFLHWPLIISVLVNDYKGDIRGFREEVIGDWLEEAGSLPETLEHFYKLNIHRRVNMTETLENYLKEKSFYTYGEITEVFLAESEEELYEEYFDSQRDDKEDYPVTLLDKEEVLNKTLYLEDDCCEGCEYNAEYQMYITKVKNFLESASEKEWKTPFQVSSSYD